VNKKCYFISDVIEIRSEWFVGVQTVGICGATSTPRWQLELALDAIKVIDKSNRKFNPIIL
jgi:4-hydroxy-3-methylbut-2-enyl diphosphate reductase